MKRVETTHGSAMHIVIKNAPGVTQAVAQLDLRQQYCPSEQEELLVQLSPHTARRLPPAGH